MFGHSEHVDWTNQLNVPLGGHLNPFAAKAIFYFLSRMAKHDRHNFMTSFDDVIMKAVAYV